MLMLRKVANFLLNSFVLPLLFGGMFYYILNLREQNTSLKIRLDNSQRQALGFMEEAQRCRK